MYTHIHIHVHRADKWNCGAYTGIMHRKRERERDRLTETEREVEYATSKR